MSDNYLNLPEPLADLDKLKDHLSTIKSLVDLESKDFQNDKLAFNSQRVLLGSLLAVYPTAIETYLNKPGQSSMYSLTNLTSQINDLFNEIRASQNLENQLSYITENILDPLIKALISGLFDAVYEQKQSIKKIEEFKSNKKLQDVLESVLNSVLTNYAKLIDTKKEEAISKLTEYLVELK